MSDLSPVKLSPAFKDHLWGGERLKTLYHKHTDLSPLAESWELSAHRDGESVVCTGPYAGQALTGYLSALGWEALGTVCRGRDTFPLLIKLIDAESDLSVQVHPSDEYALQQEGESGKTEMWYILDCEEGASLYYGFSRDITREELEAAIAQGSLTELLNRVPVHKGDVFFIPSGTVHAIGAGILLYEAQQSSNTTYRMYDYDRRDKNGCLRPLHVAKALEVSSLRRSPPPPSIPEGEDVLLAQCAYFEVRRLRYSGEGLLHTHADSFTALTVIQGEGYLNDADTLLPFRPGDTLFIPAREDVLRIQGSCELLLSRAR